MFSQFKLIKNLEGLLDKAAMAKLEKVTDDPKLPSSSVKENFDVFKNSLNLKTYFALRPTNPELCSSPFRCKCNSDLDPWVHYWTWWSRQRSPSWSREWYGILHRLAAWNKCIRGFSKWIRSRPFSLLIRDRSSVPRCKPPPKRSLRHVQRPRVGTLRGSRCAGKVVRCIRFFVGNPWSPGGHCWRIKLKLQKKDKISGNRGN